MVYLFGIIVLSFLKNFLTFAMAFTYNYYIQIKSHSDNFALPIILLV